jgi:hypothetical protein
MSLIYAKKISESEMFFISDTKFTYSEPRTCKERRHSGADEFFGGLKLVVLHGGLVVAFAGEVEFAREAIERIYERDLNLWDSKEVVQYFSGYAVGSGGKTDFLIGFYGEDEVSLIKIAGDQISIESVAWIGDKEGFSDLQRNLHGDNETIEVEIGHSNFRIIANALEKEASELTFKEITKYYSGFLKVINGSACNSVSGIITIVCTSTVGFRYTEYVSVSGPAVPATNGSGAVHFGGAAEGSFSISSGREVNCPVYTAIYHVGKFAILYSPTSSFTPSIVKLESDREFNTHFSDEVSKVAKKIDLLFERVVGS